MRPLASTLRLRPSGAAALIFGLVIGASGCPRRGGDVRPRPPAPGWSLSADVLGPDAVRGVAAIDGDGAGPAAVIATDGTRARRLGADGQVAWTAELGAAAGAVALDGDVAVVAVAGDGDGVTAAGPVSGLAGGLRGEPGAALVGLGAADGALRWTVGVGSSRWALVRAVSGAGDGFLVAGGFAGTLRIGDRTVTAAGGSDGFVAALDRGGGVRWLRRVGGDSADQLAGAVALGAGRVAIAGTFSGDAELGDTTLAPLVADAVAADGFVAVLEADGAVAWSRVYGGAREDTCAGVVALAGGVIAVAGTVRGELDVAGRRLDVRGAADGLVAIFAGDGAVKNAWLVGGDDFDGVTAIGGAGDRVAVAGWFTGALPGPDGASRAEGIDDVFVAIGDAAGLTTTVALPASEPTSVTALAVTATGWRLALHGATPSLAFRAW